MSGVVPGIPRIKFTDTTGEPLAGGSLTVYLAGTTTLATTYQDKEQTTENTNPITLDANGECLCWVDSASTYKFLLKDAQGATVSGWPVDNIPGGADLTVLASYLTLAQTAASEAQSSASTAQGYRDSLLAMAGVYASTVTGLAAVSSGAYFAVPSGVSGESFIIYLDNAGSAVEVCRLPSATAYTNTLDATTKGSYLFGQKTATFNYGTSGNPTTGSALAANTYVWGVPIPRAGAVTGFQFYASGSGTVKLKVFDSAYAQRTSVTLTVVAGLNTFTTKDIGSLTVSAGEFLGFYSTVGYSVAGSDDRATYHNGGAGDLTNPAHAGVITSISLQAQATLTYPTETAAQEIAHAALDTRFKDEAKITYRMGSQTDTIGAGSGVHGTGQTIFLDPVQRHGRIVKFAAYMTAADYVTIYQWTRSGDTLTRASEPMDIFKMPLGFSEKTLDVPVEPGVYLSAQSGNFRQDATARFPGRGYHAIAGAATTDLIDGSVVSSIAATPMFRFEIECNSYVGQVQKHRVALGRTDSVSVIGNSYMAGAYHPYKKTPIGIVSQMLGFNFDNYSLTSYDLGLRLQDLRNGVTTFYTNASDGNPYGTTSSGASWRDFRSAYVLILLGENHASATDFYNELHDMLETVTASGAIPILATEYDNVLHMLAMYRQMAERYRARFIDLSQYKVMFPQVAAALARTSHKAYRVTSAVYATHLSRALRDLLGAPRSALKMYRPRPNVTVSAIADLMFEPSDDLGHSQAVKWQEIEQGGGTVLVGDANIGYMDAIASSGSYSTTAQKYSEYQAAMLGHALSFTDYALITAYIDGLPNQCREIRLRNVPSGATVYARTVYTSGSYATSGAQQGFWSALPVVGTEAIIREWDMAGRLSGEGRVDFLISLAGAFTIARPEVVWWGQGGKTQPHVVEMKRPRGSELITTPAVYNAGALASGWSASGAPTYANTANAGDLPLGCTGYARLISTDTISFPITGITADPHYGREVEIVVWASGEKAIVNGATYAADPTVAPMSGDSWDGEQLTVEHVSGASAAKSIRTLMPYWQEVRVRTWLAAGATAITVRLGCASTGTNPDGTTKAVLVARGGCKLVDA